MADISKELATQELRSLIQRQDLVIFAGAGISVDPPTSAPMWREIQAALVDSIANILESQNWPCRSAIRPNCELVKEGLRPETFLQSLETHCPFFEYLNLLGLLKNVRPNDNHGFLSSALNDRRVKSVLTTNFDEAIERSFRDSGHRELCKLVSDDDFRKHNESIAHSAATDTAILAKLHGTISSESSIAATLSRTAVLPECKRAFLKQLMDNHPILFIGYSGFDDDLFPFLENANRSAKQDAYLCIHPNSSSDEPMQQVESPRLKRFTGRADSLLSAILGVNSTKDSTNTEAAQDRHARLQSFCQELVNDMQLWQLSCMLGYIALSNGHNGYAMFFGQLASDIIATEQKRMDLYDNILGKVCAHILEVLAQLNQGYINLPPGAYWSQREGIHCETRFPEQLARLQLLYANGYARDSSEQEMAGRCLEWAQMLRSRRFKGSPQFDRELWWAKALVKRSHGDSPAAMEAIEEAIQFSESANEPLGQARLFCDASAMYVDIDDFVAADHVASTAERLARNSGDKFLLARAWSCKAQAAFAQGHEDEGVACTTKANKLVETLKQQQSWGAWRKGTELVCPLCGASVRKNPERTTCGACRADIS